jgi:hypothetical protein
MTPRNGCRTIKKVNGKNDTPIKSPLAKVPIPNKQKRFMMVIQHEIIVYGENEKAAESSLLRTPYAKKRTNLHVVFIQEIPLHEKTEIIEDYRKAPGG